MDIEPTPTCAPSRSAGRWLWLTIASGAVMLAPSIWFGFGRDQAVHAYMGWAWLHGHWPYADVWEHNFPLTALTHAVQILICGHSMAAFRAFDGVWQLAVMAVLFMLGTRAAGPVAGVAAACLHAAYYLQLGYWSTGQRESFLMLFFLAAVECVLAHRTRPSFFYAVATGVLLGIACLYKPLAVVPAMVLVPFMLRAVPSPRVQLITLAALIFSAAFPCILLVALFMARGHADSLWEVAIQFNVEVYSLIRGEKEPFFLFTPLRHLTPLLIAGVVWAIARERRGNDDPTAFYVWLFGAWLLSYYLQGKQFAYHLLPNQTLACLLTGIAAADTVVSLRPRVRAVALGAFLGLLFLVSMPPTFPEIVRRRMPPSEQYQLYAGVKYSLAEVHAVARYLQERTAPDERIQVWGFEPGVYYLAQRFSASRFFTHHGLMMRPENGELSPLQIRWREEYLNTLSAAPPKFFVVMTNDADWYLPKGQFSDQALQSDFPALYERVLAPRYTPDTTIGRFLVYRLKTP